MPREGLRLLAGADEPPVGPQYHSFVGAKAAWEQLPDDGLPRYEGRAPVA